MLAMYRHNETRLTAGLPLENFQLPCQAIQNMATLPCFVFFEKKFKKAMKAMYFLILPGFFFK